MIELNHLYNLDCMVGMKQIPDKYFNLAIVDPPYGIGIARRGKVGSGTKAYPSQDFGIRNWDDSSPSGEYYAELFRVSCNQIIFGANHFISNIPYDSSCWIVWDKLNNGNFADCELAWTSFKTAVRKFAFRWDGYRQGDMRNKERRIHPTQKPIPLYKWLLTNYAKTGDKILDTHVGSASSLIACYRLGFDFIGFEIDTDYHSKATQRLSEAMSQQRLLI